MGWGQDHQSRGVLRREKWWVPKRAEEKQTNAPPPKVLFSWSRGHWLEPWAMGPIGSWGKDNY